MLHKPLPPLRLAAAVRGDTDLRSAIPHTDRDAEDSGALSDTLASARARQLLQFGDSIGRPSSSHSALPAATAAAPPASRPSPRVRVVGVTSGHVGVLGAGSVRAGGGQGVGATAGNPWDSWEPSGVGPRRPAAAYRRAAVCARWAPLRAVGC